MLGDGGIFAFFDKSVQKQIPPRDLPFVSLQRFACSNSVIYAGWYA